jgi:hypothetical protein
MLGEPRSGWPVCRNQHHPDVFVFFRGAAIVTFENSEHITAVPLKNNFFDLVVGTIDRPPPAGFRKPMRKLERELASCFIGLVGRLEIWVMKRPSGCPFLFPSGPSVL